MIWKRLSKVAEPKEKKVYTVSTTSEPASAQEADHQDWNCSELLLVLLRGEPQWFAPANQCPRAIVIVPDEVSGNGPVI
jgi:hypothetical protein